MRIEIDEFIKILCETMSEKEATNDDKAILKVSFLVSALDGTISSEEYKALEYFAGRFNSLDKSAYEQLVDSTLRTAGFLLLCSQRMPREEFLKLFVKEALAILPGDFMSKPSVMHRAAMVFWMSMAFSDDEYSAIERAAIVALGREFAASLNPDGDVSKFERRVSGILSVFDVDPRKSLAELRDVIAGN